MTCVTNKANWLQEYLALNEGRSSLPEAALDYWNQMVELWALRERMQRHPTSDYGKEATGGCKHLHV